MSTNPIIRDEAMTRWKVNAARPTPTADTCFVFVDGKGQVYAPEQPITVGQAVWGSLRRLYEVDLAEHNADLSCSLPCAEKGYYFDAALRLRWRVHGPDVIVRDRRNDVVPVYTDYLTEFLASHSELYGLKERGQAQNELQQKLNQPIALREGITIVRCGITLTLGEAAEAHLRRSTETEFTLEAGQQDFAVETQVGEQRGAHQKRQAELQAELAQLRRAQELDEQRHAQALEEMQLQAKFDRMKMYAQALQEGNNSALLFLLDQHHGDIVPVIELIMAERKNNLENARELTMGLVDRGFLGGADVDPAARRALQNLIDGLDPAGFDRALGGGTGSRPELPEEAGRKVEEGRVVEGRSPRDEDDDDDVDDDY